MSVGNLPPANRRSLRKPRLTILLIANLWVAITLACSLPGFTQNTPVPPTATVVTSRVVDTPVPPPPPTPTPEPLPPGLVESQPAAGSEIPLQGPITLYFNQAMDHSSVEAALTGLAGDYAWPDDATLVFTPTTPLAPGAQVDLSLGTAARAASGLALPAPLTLTFQAAGYLDLAQQLPAPGAREVDPTSAVVATFNRPVVPLGADPASLPAAFSLKPAAAGRGEWLNTSTYVFYPQPALAGGAQYAVQLAPDLTGTDGSPLQNKDGWSFSTAAPRLVSIEPPDGSADVRLDTAIQLDFNQPMDANSVLEGLSLLDPEANAIPGKSAWNEDFTTLYFTPTNLLKRDLDYTIVLNGEAQGRGGTPLGTEARAAFHTVPSLDVISSEPLPGGLRNLYAGVTIHFSAPIEAKDALQYVTFEPDVPDLYTYVEDDDRTLHLYGRYDPDTDYELIISPNLPDAWNGRLGREFSLKFRTQPLAPNLFVTPGSDVLFLTPQDTSLAAQATNLPGVSLSLGSLPLADFMTMLGPNGYDLRQTYQPADLRNLQQGFDLTPNRSQAVEMPLSQDGVPLNPGLYFLRFKPGAEDLHVGPYLLVVSNLNLTFKLSATNVLVWAVDLRDGQPAAGAPVTVYGEDGSVLAAGQTDAEGIFQADLASALADVYSTSYAVIGQPGEDNFSLALSNWSQGVESWNFGISTDFTPPHDEAYLYTDRPIYRPGQTVFFRAVVRQAYNGRYSLPDMATLPLSLTNDTGQQVAAFQLDLSAFGTAHGSYTLPANAAPGYYRLSNDRLNYSDVNFQVADYRKPEIDLQVAAGAVDVLAGEAITATVTARYFFDAPVGDLPVHYTLSKAPAFFDLPGYRVGKEDDRWLSAYPLLNPNPFGELVSEGDARTDAAGVLNLSLPTDAADTRQRYTLEVTAKDESGLPVSARTSLQTNPADYYIGVRPDTWIGQAGTAIGFDVLVVDWARDPAGSQALRAEFQKVVWVRVDPASGDPYAFPTYVPHYTPVGSTDFTTGADGIARLAFTPPAAGSYQLAVRDASGAGAVTQVIVWVGGPGQAVWPDLPDQRLRLTSDQASYQPGQSAQVFIPNPFLPDPGSGQSRALALVTVERGAVLRHQVLTIEGSGTQLDLPLSAEDAPNVYLSVSLLGQTAAGKPDFRQGYLNLPVTPVEQTLNVTLTSQPEKAAPGQDVTFGVRVTDAAGAPVQGEFSLSVVDLAVLALADPNSQAIVPAFYGEQPLGVRTGLALTAYSQRQSFLPEGGLGGGGGEIGTQLVVRENFPDTAYWDAAIVTDENGQAQVSLTLPDSLTTWQVDVRGLTADTRVGEALSKVVVTKDLLVRPVTPRFLVVGDHALLAAVVQNNTSSGLQAQVALQATGFDLDPASPAALAVDLPPGGRARVEWWGTAQDVPGVDLVFSVQAGDLSDAARPANGALPVLHYSAPQTYGTSGILEFGGQQLELVSLPRSFSPSGGNLQVDLSPSLAAAMLNSLDALDQFAYDCTEQVLSRFLPNLETYRTIQDFGLQDAGLQARLDRTLNQGIAMLLARQNPDGGWGWWPAPVPLPVPSQPEGSEGSPGAAPQSDSDPYISAYVLFGLSRAQAAGVSVDPTALQKGNDYLLASLPTPDMLKEPWQFDRLAFEQFVLAQVGSGDQGGAAALYEARSQLDPWASALLALTLEGYAKSDPRTETLFSDLAGKALRSATGAHWEDQVPDWRNMSTPVFTSAVVLYALAQHDPASPLVAEAVRYLMDHRQATGAWASTYETSWTLLALTQVLKGTGELSGDFSFSAALNGAPLASGQAGGDTQLTPVAASTPLDSLHPQAPNALLIERSDGPGRLYYSAHLQVDRPVEEAAPLDQGISISRAYYPVNAVPQSDNAQAVGVEPIHTAQAGDLVQVRLTLVVPQAAYYLLVEDYLPAGAEVLDVSLKTSQQAVPDCSAQLAGCYNPRAPFEQGWGWWYFRGPQIYDDHVAWAAESLPPGTYQLTYTLALLQAGEYHLLPARAWQFYFPEVQGNSAGDSFEIKR